MRIYWTFCNILDILYLNGSDCGDLILCVHVFGVHRDILSLSRCWRLENFGSWLRTKKRNTTAQYILILLGFVKMLILNSPKFLVFSLSFV